MAVAPHARTRGVIPFIFVRVRWDKVEHTRTVTRRNMDIIPFQDILPVIDTLPLNVFRTGAVAQLFYNIWDGAQVYLLLLFSLRSTRVGSNTRAHSNIAVMTWTASSSRDLLLALFLVLEENVGSLVHLVKCVRRLVSSPLTQ